MTRTRRARKEENMKKTIALMLAAAMAAVSLTGCVKIIDKGTEGEYTGEVAFDAAADSSSDWAQVVTEITENATDLADLLNGDWDGKAKAVKVSAPVKEYESKANGKKNALILDVEGFDGTVKVQIGSIYSGTDVRDIQSVKNFESFTNQTEWSQYAKALNTELDTQVVSVLGIDDSVVGKTVTLTGAAAKSGDEITLTPVSLTIE